MMHNFDGRFFCAECGVDAIGLQAWGPKAMERPFSKDYAKLRRDPAEPPVIGSEAVTQ